MEQINKLLIILVALAIGVMTYITLDVVKTAKSITSDVVRAAENKNVAPHPYNECIKLLIDQVNKENKESDFEKMKLVCSGLLEQRKD